MQIKKIIEALKDNPPCDYDFGEYMLEKDCEWCLDNCGEKSNEECWKHLIYLRKKEKDRDHDEYTKIVKILMEFFPEEPCCYNNMDELTICDYCEEHCDNHNITDCWINAIKNEWYKH